ncbi:cysteine proteinase [Xylariomycetidae sp. FL2044]|nr:cysteine proteinase [Xylariomycetidae sp. FL2044]
MVIHAVEMEPPTETSPTAISPVATPTTQITPTSSPNIDQDTAQKPPAVEAPEQTKVQTPISPASDEPSQENEPQARVSTEPSAENLPLTNGARRSGRARKATTKFDGDHAGSNDVPIVQSEPLDTQTRPKRKASQIAAENVEIEDFGVVMEHFVARMTDDELREYRGWVELESEPAFFNAMLRKLGAQELKIEEIFGLDSMTFEQLPKPVNGLIFLYQYTDEDESSENRQSCPADLWFGNQTMSNGCATVALMNIIMNAKDIHLGKELKEFKESTMPLPPPHRGHTLDKNDFIRSIHNSVARRGDLLSEDLLLDNKFEAAERRKKRAVTKKVAPSRSKQKKQKKQEDTAYHYIAYVEVGGQVWELDGFEAEPLCLGPYQTTWLETASEAIQNRMQRNEFLSYNLLAVCNSPLRAIAETFARKVAASRALHEAMSGKDPEWDIPHPFDTFTKERLGQLNLTQDFILAIEEPTPDTQDGPAENSRVLARSLLNEELALETEYTVELAVIDESLQTIHGRQRDYTPVINTWVRFLAEKGALRGLIKQLETDD